MKKIFAVFLTLCLVVGLIPSTVLKALSERITISADQVSGIGLSTNPVQNIVDGDKNTYWQSMSQSGEGSHEEKEESKMYDHNRYIDIKLNGTYDLTEIKIYNNEGPFNNYYVYASLDGENYDKIVSKTNDDIATSSGDSHNISKRASYIRLNMAYNSEKYETNLAEIEVYGVKISDKVTEKEEISVSNWEGSEWQKEWDKFESDKKYANQKTITEVTNLVGRVIGDEWKSKFVFEIRDSRNGKDVFEIENGDGVIIIRGNDGVSLASGFNYYLKNFAMVDYNPLFESNTDMNNGLVPVNKKVVKETQYDVRYALNFCTYSYTMAFWNWDEYQEFIDWAAMNGVNLMLDIVGQEEVIRQTLLQYNFTDDEIKEYLAGPGYFAWFYMQNLYSFGGPLPDNWFEQRVELGRKMHDRMQAFGIDPVIQGFCGQVPLTFDDKNEGAVLTAIDTWPSFTRPAMIKTYLSDEEVNSGKKDYFTDVASTFYEAQKNIFGDVSNYYASDPFHEGGNTTGLDVANIYKTVQEEMLKSNNDAIWVMQQWQGNLNNSKLSGLVKPEQALALDLQSDLNPSNVMENANVPWVWCMLHNFGGRMGLDGEIPSIATDPALAASSNKNMKGIGIAPEALENSPVVYELLFDMTWSSDPINYTKWLEKYAERRAGGTSDSLQEAWEILLDTAYSDKGTYFQGAGETVINSRPGTSFSSASTWGHSKVFYDKEKLDKALELLIENYDAFSASPAYRYDLADVAEQVLCNAAIEYHSLMVQALNNKDSAEFKRISSHYLELIDLSDQILSTNEEFMLGTWIDDARTMLADADDWTKDLFEFNARALVTTWGGQRSNSLKDYSNRKWGGLTGSFYKERWAMWISNRQAELDGTQKDSIAAKAEKNWFMWEWQWANRKSDDGFAFDTKPNYSNLKELATTALTDYSTTSLKDFVSGEVEEKVNIAAGKLFTTNPNTDESMRALLTDENTEGLWTVEGTDKYELILDLEGTYDLSTVEIYLQQLAVDFNYTYKVEVYSPESQKWVTIKENAENDVMTSQTVIEFEKGVNSIASQVKITMSTRDSSVRALSVSEIKVFGTEKDVVTYYNVASGLIAECDHETEGSDIKYLTDENIESLWKTKWFSSKDAMYPAVVTLDLNYAYDDAKFVEVYFEKTGLPFKFRVAVMDETDKETIILDKTDNTSVLEDRSYKIVIPENIGNVKKVKVYFDDSTGQGAASAASPAMTELKVLGLSDKKTEKELENVALNKPVKVSSINPYGDYKASHITDGNKKTAWSYNGNTDKDSGNAEVDLKGLHYVDKIDLTFIKENYTKYYMFDVYVITEDGNKSVLFSEKGANLENYVINVKQNVKQIGVDYKGKSQLSDGWFDIIELEAYGYLLENTKDITFGEGKIDGITSSGYENALDGNLETFINNIKDTDVVFDLKGNYYVNSVDLTFEKAGLGIRYMVYTENSIGERTLVLDRSTTNAILDNRVVNVKVNRDATKIIFKHLGNNGKGEAHLADSRLYEFSAEMGTPKDVGLIAKTDTEGAENILDGTDDTSYLLNKDTSVLITLNKPTDVNMIRLNSKAVTRDNISTGYLVEVLDKSSNQWQTVYNEENVKSSNLIVFEKSIYTDQIKVTAKNAIDITQLNIYEIDMTQPLLTYIDEVREVLNSKRYDDNNGSYTLAAKEKVENLLVDAEKAISNGLSSEEVEEWTNAIKSAVKDFERNGIIYVDRSDLLVKISETEILIDKLKDYGLITDIDILENKLNEALGVYNKYLSTQAELDNMSLEIAELSKTYYDLLDVSQRFDVELTMAKNLLNDTEKGDLHGQISNEDYIKLEGLLSNIQTEFNESNNKEEVLEKLKDAILNFQNAIINVDKTNLLGMIQSIDNLDKSKFDYDTWSALLVVRNNAQSVYETDKVSQKTVNDSIIEIENAIANLIELNYSDLRSLMDEIDLLDKEDYTPETWETLANVYKSGIDLFGRDDVRQGEIDSIIEKLTSAKDALVKVENSGNDSDNDNNNNNNNGSNDNNNDNNDNKDDTEKGDSTQNSDSINKPSTGDTTNSGLWFTLMLGAGALLVIRKRSKKA